MNEWEAISSRHGFRNFIRGDLESFWPQVAFWKVKRGAELDSRERELVKLCTGLEDPQGPFSERWLIAGRQSGKSTVQAIEIATGAIWGGWEKHASRGELLHVPIISPTMAQGQVIKRYLDGLFDSTAALRKLVKRTLAESIELHNGVLIEIKPASWRSTRGFRYPFVSFDEVAFLRFEVETANPDREIYNAVLPGQSTFPGSELLGCSTPFSKQGLLADKFDRHWTRRGPVLIWKAPTWVMNPTLDEKRLRERYLESMGPAEFEAEFGAGFREDIEQYLPLQIIEEAVVSGVEYLGPRGGRQYVAFADAAEGLRKGADSMTFAVAHSEAGRVCLDMLLEWQPPFDPKEVIVNMVQALRLYGVRKVRQDRHSLGWISSDLEPHGVEVEVAEMSKSEIYQRFAVLMSKGLVRLLDLSRLKSQLAGLQRFLRGGGQTTVDHLRGGKDDCANSAAGAAVAAAEEADDTGSVMTMSRHNVYPDDNSAGSIFSRDDVHNYFRKRGL